MAEQDKGLPMTSKWDPGKLQQEIAELDAIKNKSFSPGPEVTFAVPDRDCCKVP